MDTKQFLSGELTVRYSMLSDLEEIVNIQNHYNTQSIGTFDAHNYTANQKLNWFKQFDNSSPYKLVVATVDNKIAGYASSIAFRDRGVFARTIETSVYVHPEFLKKGIGGEMYRFLFQELARHDLHRAVVGIALPNSPSIRLHRKMGFTEIGTFDEYAFFKDRFVSSLWMQKKLVHSDQQTIR